MDENTLIENGYLYPDEAAAMLGVSVNDLYRLGIAGRLQPYVLSIKKSIGSGHFYCGRISGGELPKLDGRCLDYLITGASHGRALLKDMPDKLLIVMRLSLKVSPSSICDDHGIIWVHQCEVVFKRQEVSGLKVETQKPISKSGHRIPIKEPYASREELLRLILGMAIEAYGYNPNAERNTVSGDKAGSISDRLNVAGIAISTRSVQRILKEAKELN